MSSSKGKQNKYLDLKVGRYKEFEQTCIVHTGLSTVCSSLVGHAYWQFIAEIGAFVSASVLIDSRKGETII